MSDVFHLGLSRQDCDGCTVAILPGDPDRVERIARHLDAPRRLAREREFHSWRGGVGASQIIVCSTGIGGPSTSIAVEELAQLGVDTFIRVGTTGAIQAKIEVGDIIITSGAVRLDGASSHFAPLEYPAVAHFDCVEALVASARSSATPHHVGVTVSSDTFYPGQERYDTVSGYVRRSLQGSLEEWTRLGALNYEMESATLLTMCATMGLRAGMVAGVLVNRNLDEIPDLAEHAVADHALAERRAIDAAIGAARRLTSSTPTGPR